MKYLSALDWSGDGGDPAKTPGLPPLLVIVTVTLDVDDAKPRLHNALSRARRERNLPETHCFHHVSSKPAVTQAFFRALQPLPICVTASLIDKHQWDRTYIRSTTGNDRVISEIVKHVCNLPATTVAGQQLIVDLESQDTKLLDALRKSIRHAMRLEGRRSFADIRACPDRRRTLGDVIQVADMIAGQLRKHRAIDGPHLPLIKDRIVILD